jgi:hypothetical protein
LQAKSEAILQAADEFHSEDPNFGRFGIGYY